MATFSLGGSVGYADPKTLSNRGACRKRPNGTINYAPVYPHPPGAIQEFRLAIPPGVVAGVRERTGTDKCMCTLYRLGWHAQGGS